MCVTVYIGEANCDCVGDLRAYFDPVIIPDEEAMDARNMDVGKCCLCVVDLEATAKANGKTLTSPAHEDSDPMEYRFT